MIMREERVLSPERQSWNSKELTRKEGVRVERVPEARFRQERRIPLFRSVRHLFSAFLLLTAAVSRAGAFLLQPGHRHNALLRSSPMPTVTRRRRLVRLQSLQMTTNSTDPSQSLHHSLPKEAGDPFLNNKDNRYASSDWWHVIKNTRTSTILRAVKNPVLAVTIWSTLVSLVYKGLQFTGRPNLAFMMCINSKLHSFLVSALGLLLVFRTNSAYQKFAEGRRIWERIHSVSRSISRMSKLYEQDLGPARLRRVSRLLAAFPYLLHHHIQPDSNANVQGTEHGLALRRTESVSRRSTGRRVRPGVVVSDANKPSDTLWVDKRSLPWSLFPPKALQSCADSSNRPLWLCDRLSQELTNVVYSPNFTSRERLSFLSAVDKLSQSVGECERINQTAVPLNYARHLLRSLSLWLFTLPFALIEDFGLFTGPVMALTAWNFFGIYEIGFSIEDPFQGSLRLSILCDAIYRDVMEGSDFTRRRETAFEIDEEEWNEVDGRRQVLKGMFP